MDVLILRFDAPLMSFGGPIVDRHGVIQPYPALSMMTGLLANSLGYRHLDAEHIQSLQARLRFASRQDRSGRQIRDYQTVDLSREHMNDDRGWTTHSEIDQRKGGAASSGTHIRLRDYWADCIYTIALTLDPFDETPTLDEVERALQFPERPLFIGRKACIPSEPIFAGRLDAPSLLDALRHVGLPNHADKRRTYRVWWPIRPGEDQPSTGIVSDNFRRPVTDSRDWANQIHSGERWISEGEITLVGT